MAARQLSDETEAAIAAKYVAGEGAPALSKKFSVKTDVIYGLLRRQGVQVRDARACHMKCTLDESVFDEWTPEASYWAGFLFADGCISFDARGQSSPKLELTLKGSDSDHVAAFRSFMGSNHKLHSRQQSAYGGGHSCVKFSVHSTKAVDRLQSIGIVKGRGPVLDSFLASSRDFWRGVVDGDGCLGWSKPSNPRHQSSPYIFAVGHEKQMEQFAAFVRSVSPNVRASVQAVKGVHQFRVGGVYARDLAAVLYRDSTVSLPRKHDEAMKIAEHTGRRVRRCSIEGCGAVHMARDMCSYHYHRKRNGAVKVYRKEIPAII